MKAFYKSIMLIAAAAMTFVSCQKEIENQEIDNGPKMKTIKVSTDIATRTTLDSNHENLVWSSGDKISIFNDVDNANYGVTYSPDDEYIVVEVPGGTTEIYAHYPYYGDNTDGPESASVYISNNQTQKNPGELNGYYFPMVAKGTVSADNKALISFYPVASALALNIYHTGLDGEESVKSVKVTPSSSNTNFTGRQVTDLTGDNIQYTEAASSGPITVTLTNALALSSTKPADKQTFAGQIYVCLAKQSYANVKFEIETTKGTYTITSNDTPFNCVNNDFVPVNINLDKADFEGPVNPTDFSWTLVKNSLAVGDKVVIAAAASNVAMSTTQNNNNRGQIAITKSSDFLTANDDVQVFEVVAGSSSGTVALKCLNGDEIGQYIYAASSSKNYLRSKNSIDGDASWSIDFASTGVATVTAQGNNTRNLIRYNSSDKLFSCYESNTSGADIVFYRAGLPSANLSFPEGSYTANLGGTFTAPALSNPNNVVVTYSSSNTAIATVNSNGEVTIGSTAGQVTITASFAGNETYSASEASYIIEVIDPSVEQWIKTAIGNITASDVFVIVGDDGYALPHNNGSSNAPGLVAVTVFNNKITSEVSNDIKWNISGNNSDGYVFYPNGDKSIWLYCTNANNGVRVGTNDNKQFKLEDGYLVNLATSRYLSVLGTQDWRCYGNKDNNPQVIEFYVKLGGSSTPSKTLSSISVTDPTKTTYKVGDTFDATGMVVTATYSDATTADVTASATTDFATQVASAGNKTVTVSYTEDGVTKTDTFSITVAQTTGVTVSFDPSNFSGQGTSSSGSAISATKDGITFSCDKGYGTTQIRCYSGGKITISAESGKTIKSISFTFSGTYTGGLDAGYTPNYGTWEKTLSSQARLTEVSVTYE